MFGGHPSVTPLVHEAVTQMGADAPGRVELHLALAFEQELHLPAHVMNAPVVTRCARWWGEGTSKSDDLATMHAGMIDRSLTAAVFVGGKTHGYQGQAAGQSPGIHQEFDAFVAARGSDRHAYRLGLARGAAWTLRRDTNPIGRFLRDTPDPDLATALIVADLLDP